MAEAYYEHFHIRFCESLVIKLHGIADRVLLYKQSCGKLGMIKRFYLTVSVMGFSDLKVTAVSFLLSEQYQVAP